MRARQMGRFIWGTCCDRRIYLDGQAFGQPRYELDVKGDQVAFRDLVLPSGSGERASDFESWLLIALPGKEPVLVKVVSASERGGDP